MDTKHEVSIVRAKAHAERQDGTKAARWTRVTEAQNDNKNTIQSLVNQTRQMVNELEQMCAWLSNSILLNCSGQAVGQITEWISLPTSMACHNSQQKMQSV